MLIKTYSLRPHCVSCWTTCILQDDSRTLQCQVKRTEVSIRIMARSVIMSLNFWIQNVHPALEIKAETSTLRLETQFNVAQLRHTTTIFFLLHVISKIKFSYWRCNCIKTHNDVRMYALRPQNWKVHEDQAAL